MTSLYQQFDCLHFSRDKHRDSRSLADSMCTPPICPLGNCLAPRTTSLCDYGAPAESVSTSGFSTPDIKLFSRWFGRSASFHTSLQFTLNRKVAFYRPHLPQTFIAPTLQTLHCFFTTHDTTAFPNQDGIGQILQLREGSGRALDSRSRREEQPRKR